jgi:NDP-sugar pyrophosphorylase family protein
MLNLWKYLQYIHIQLIQPCCRQVKLQAWSIESEKGAIVMIYVNHTQEMKKLSEQPTVHETANIYNSYLGAWTEIGPRVLLVDSVIGDYTYLMDEVNIH